MSAATSDTTTKRRLFLVCLEITQCWLHPCQGLAPCTEAESQVWGTLDVFHQ